MIDKDLCMSMYLSLRFVAQSNLIWAEGWEPILHAKDFGGLMPVSTAKEIDGLIKKIFDRSLSGKIGILLSGGMDSAILASYLPKGTMAYTIRSNADIAVDEIEKATVYSDILNLNLKIVEVTWDDYLLYTPELMRHKKSPVHSIEPLIYKAALAAKADGVECLVSGESADAHFGGMDGLLSKDWTFDDFVKRYTYVDPFKVLHSPRNFSSVFEPYRTDYGIDSHKFVSEIFFTESLNSYLNPTLLAGVSLCAPFSEMRMGVPIDLQKIRNDASKYLIRELHALRFPALIPNRKLPMPRAVGQWLANWQGPKRPEFKKIAIEEFSGDQKWLLFCLEMFLDLIEEKSK